MKLPVFAVLFLLQCLLAMPASAQKYVCMESNKGDWCLELLRDVAPRTVDNFLRYVNAGDYNTMFFHRSVPGFVLQGGGFRLAASGAATVVPNYGTIPNEYRRSNLRGTVAMAKTAADPNSASNQWFVNLADNSTNLDNQNGGFTVFAEVVLGLDVIDRISRFRVGNLTGIFGTGFAEVPVDIPATATTVDVGDFVIVNRAYATDTLPGQPASRFHCSAAVANEALTELCGSEVSFPLQIVNGGRFEATLVLTAQQPALTFTLKPGSLKPLSDVPAVLASFDEATAELLIPSVRVGTLRYTSVRLKLTNVSALQFTLQGFTGP
ncbi:MAG: peptidylprolyl isomerase [Pseudohongiellaceae bacterium]